jgi:mRNA interferase MazF
MAKAPRPQRGEIWSVQFDPSIGAEIRKLRPAVVASLDSIGRLPLRIVVPLTDWQNTFARLPWFTRIDATDASGLLKDPGADAFQVKSVSETRFVRKLGVVTGAQMDEIAAAVAICDGTP